MYEITLEAATHFFESPCPVWRSYFASPILPSMLLLHFDQVSARSHAANFLPLLPLSINDSLDAMMIQRALLNILDEI